MKIIIDSNVLFSALIKDSAARGIILRSNILFLFPSYIFDEMEKHINELLAKSGMRQEDFNALLSLLLEKVLIVPQESIEPYKKEAVRIVKDIDINDSVFIACALAHKGSAIWSEDKMLKQQCRIKVLNTKEIIKLSE
jgi:predicted nucleic acid-binding protein